MKRRPVCGDCGRELKPKENGVSVVYYEKYGEKIKPYEVRAADLWFCPLCGFTITCGYAEKGIKKNLEEYIENLLESDKTVIKVRTHRISEEEGSFGIQD